jgi:hypothetical protein
MTRNAFNFVIDAASFLVVLGLIGTGLINRFVLPPRSGGMSVWGLTRHDWGDVHFWLAVVAGGLLLVHLALHWQWVCVTACRLLPYRGTNPAAGHPVGRSLVGVALIAVVIGAFWLFLGLARSVVKEDERERGGRRHGTTSSLIERSEEPKIRSRIRRNPGTGWVSIAG